jgi:hypothetical protein
MQPLNLKLPPDSLKTLRAEAERLRCYPSALGRHLIIRGLQELKDQEA